MKKFDKGGRILYGTLTLLVLVVIYGQSMLNRQDSAGVSGFAVTYLKPILDPMDWYTPEAFHHFIRKAGHFTEYFFLGLFFGKFYAVLRKNDGKRNASTPLLTVLAVAVSDEYLQFFTGRGSMVTDVVLDFSGALCGLLLVSLWGYLLHKRSITHEAGLQ